MRHLGEFEVFAKRLVEVDLTPFHQTVHSESEDCFCYRRGFEQRAFVHRLARELVALTGGMAKDQFAVAHQGN